MPDRRHDFFSTSALTYRDNCADASATSAGVIVTDSRSIMAGSILGSKTHTGPRSEGCSTNQPGNTTTPRTGNFLPVNSSRWLDSHRAAALACSIGFRSGIRPATRRVSHSIVMFALGHGFENVLVSMA